MWWTRRTKRVVTSDLFSPTVEFLSQPRGIVNSPGPWIPGEETKLPNAKSRVGVLFHMQSKDGGLETVSVTLNHEAAYYSTCRGKNNQCDWKVWQRIQLTPFCVCGEIQPGEYLLHDALTDDTPKARKGHINRHLPVEHPHGFWLHCPEMAMTEYFFARSGQERKQWVATLQHNLELMRHGQHAERNILKGCEESLGKHGFIGPDLDGMLLQIKQKLRYRVFDALLPDDNDVEIVEDAGNGAAAVSVSEEERAAAEEAAARRVFLAVEDGNVTAVKEALLQHKVKINYTLPPIHGGHTLLMSAVAMGLDDLVDILVKYKPDLNAVNVYGDTALIIACRLGRASMAKKILDAGCDVDVANVFGETAASESTATGQTRILCLGRQIGLRPAAPPPPR